MSFTDSRLQRSVLLLAFASLCAAFSVPPARAAEPPVEPMLRIETGMHTAMIRRISVDAKARWLATSSEDKTVRVWELASGRLLQILRPPHDYGDEGKLYSVAMSPDGETIAAAGWTGYNWERINYIYIFQRATGRMIHRITGLQDVINHLTFSPDGRWLGAALGVGKGVRVYRAGGWNHVGQDSEYGDGS